MLVQNPSRFVLFGLSEVNFLGSPSHWGGFVQGILIIRPEEPLYFANIQGIKSILTRIEYLGAPHAHPSGDGAGVTELKAIILHCGNIPTIDARYDDNKRSF